MIYGVNFGGAQIPEIWKKRFAARRSMGGRVMAVLQGVATSARERDMMLVQADNGRRKLHVEERRTRIGPIYGVYVYSGDAPMRPENTGRAALDRLRPMIKRGVEAAQRKREDL